jgi:hypothetical protein
MHQRSRRWLGGIAAVLIATAGGGALAVPALAAASPQQSATGDFTAAVFHVDFTASRPAGGAPTSATGTFTAQTSLGSLSLLTVSGPVTCLDVVGDEVGLFYPVANSTPSVFGQLDLGVYFYAKLGANGKPEAANFLPVPTQRVSSCAPLPTLIPASSGTLSLTP